MNMKLFINDEWITLFNAQLNKVNKERVKTLDKSEIGRKIIIQCAVNHKVGVMNMNDALDAIFEEVDNENQ